MIIMIIVMNIMIIVMMKMIILIIMHWKVHPMINNEIDIMLNESQSWSNPDEGCDVDQNPRQDCFAVVDDYYDHHERC